MKSIISDATIENIKRLAHEERKKYNRLRYGQCIFNIVYNLYPDVVGLIPTNVDPFYKDSNVDAFLDELKKKYNEVVGEM